ncbi:MAG TPA: LPS export ABC transporter periplasmic protein LptC [Gammaproteobacteria bacterium]|nr:LPS export ABC transporter periplasmic protein LptC [Gammaproteobacteria bacterium]
MISIRSVVIGLALSLSAGLSWWLYAQLQSTIRPTSSPPRHVVDYYAENFTATAMGDQGKPRHRLEATKLVHYLDDDTSKLTRPRLQIFQAGAPPWRVRADVGWVSSGGKTVRLQDDVQIHRAAGAHTRPVDAYTTWLLIRPDDGYAETNRPIRTISAGVEVESVGMQAYLDQDRLKLLSRVRGTYDQPKSHR